MSNITVSDVQDTIKDHNIYIKKIDSLLSFNSGELTIYKNLSKFKDIDEYDIPIYKNLKTITKYNFKKDDENYITIDVDDFLGKKNVKIIFEKNNPDGLKIITNNSKSAAFNVVYINKMDFKTFKMPKKPKKYKISEVGTTNKIVLASYYLIMFFIFFLLLILMPLIGSMSKMYILAIAISLTFITHFKTKDMILHIIDNNIDKINNILYK